MVPEDNSLEQAYEGSPYDSSLEAGAPVQSTSVSSTTGSGFGHKKLSPFHYNKLAFMITGIALAVILIVGGGSVLLSTLSGKKNNDANVQKSDKYAVGSLEVNGIQTNSKLNVGEVNQLDVNGQLQVSKTLVIAPTTAPTAPTLGQIYFDKATNTPYYYNGTTFVSLSPQRVTSVGGSSGVLNVGGGLSVVNNTINNTGVTSIQGQAGDVNFTAGSGIKVNGTTITNSGILSVTGTPNQIGVINNNGDVQVSLLGVSNGGVVIGQGGGLATIKPTSAGQCLISDGSSLPVFGSCTGTTTVTSIQPGSSTALSGALKLQGSGAVSISGNGTDTITISAPIVTPGGNVSYAGSSTTTGQLVRFNNTTGTIEDASIHDDNVGLKLQTTSDAYYLDVSAANDSTLTIKNSTSGKVANLSVEGYVQASSIRDAAGNVYSLETNPSGTDSDRTICYVYTDTSTSSLASNCPAGGNVSATGTSIPSGTVAIFSADRTIKAATFLDASVSGSNGLQFTADSSSAYYLDLLKSTADTTLTVKNSDGSHVANLAVEGGISVGVGFLQGTDTYVLPADSTSGITRTLCYKQTVASVTSGNCTGGDVSFASGTQATNRLAYIDGSNNLASTELSYTAGTLQVAASSYNLDVKNDGAASTLTIKNSGTGGQVANLSVTGAISAGGSITAGAGTNGGFRGDTLQSDLAHMNDGSNDLKVTSTNNNIVFSINGGAQTFLFPTTGGTGQTICTSGISCASGGGQAVLLGPTDGATPTPNPAAQTFAGSSSAIWINGTGSGNLLQLQAGGNDALVVNSAGAVVLGKAGNGTVGSGVSGKLSFANSQSSSIVSIQATPNSSAYTLYLPTGGLPSGSSTSCLITDSTGHLSFTTCLSGSSGGSGGVIGVTVPTSSSTTTLSGTLTLTSSDSSVSILNNGSDNVIDITVPAATPDTTVFKNGGNSFGGSTAAQLGTNDANNLNFRTNGVDRLALDQSGSLQFLQGSTLSVAQAASGAGNQLTVVAGAAAAAGNNNGGNLLLQGGAGGGTGTTGSVIVKANGSNSATAFQVQNSAGKSVAAVNSSTGLLSLGDQSVSGGIQGGIVFNNANNNRTVTLLSSSRASTGANGTTPTNVNVYIPDDPDQKAVGGVDYVCLQALGNCSASASNFISNSTSKQAPGNFYIQAKDSTTAGTIGGIIQGAAGGQTVDLMQFLNTGGSVVASVSATGKLTTTGLTSAGADASINDSSNFNTSINGGTSTGTVTIGNNAAGAVSIQGGNGISIGTASAAANAITIGGTGTTGTITLGQSTDNNTIDIGNNTIATTKTGTIHIGTNATGTGKTAITIGSTNGASSLALQGGSGGVNLSATGGAVNVTAGAASTIKTTSGTLTLQGGNGSGANNAGSNTILNGGQGTGTAAGGDIVFQTAKGGTSGSSTNSLNQVFKLSGVNGSALFQNSTNSASALQVLNQSGKAVATVDTTNGYLNLGDNTAGGVNGGIVFNNAGNTLSVTLQAAARVGASSTALSLVIPDDPTNKASGSDEICLKTLANCTSGAGGSSNFINNSYSTLQQNANFHIQTGAVGNATAVITALGSQTANLLEFRSSNDSTVIAKVDAAGNLTATSGSFAGGVAITNATGSLQIQSAYSSSGYISKGAQASGAISANDVVVLNGVASTNQTVSDTTTARDVRVYGIAQSSATNGNSLNVVTSGNFVVNATTLGGTKPIAVGDQLVTSATSGMVMADNNATTGIIGTALSALASGTGTVNISVRPVNGQSAPRFQNATDSSNAFQVQNAAGKSLFNVDSTNGKVTLGDQSASGVTGQLVFNTSNNNQAIILQAGATATGYTLMLPTTVGAANQCLTAGSTGTEGQLKFQDCSAGTFVQGGNNFGTLTNNKAILGTLDANDLAIYTGGSQRLLIDRSNNFTFTNSSTLNVASAASGQSLTIKGGDATSGTNVGGNLVLQGGAGASTGASGSVIVKSNTNNSTAAFQVQNAAGTSIVNVDTTNGRLSVGSLGTPTGQLYVSGQLPTSALSSISSTTLSGTMRKVKMVGRYIYAASDTNFYVIDNADPSSPTVLGSVSATTQVSNMEIAGKYAYITTGSAGTIKIVDVSKPNAPTAVGTISGFTNSYGIKVQGRYLYVTDISANLLKAYDISNPVTPAFVGSVAITGSVQDMYIQGSYAYVTGSSNSTLQIYDISNPASMSSAGSLSLTASSQPTSVWVQGKYAYIGSNSTTYTVRIVDVSNPASPSLVSTSALPNTPSGNQSVRVQGKYMYVSTYLGALMYVYDVTNPASPASLGSFSVSPGNWPISYDLAGRYLTTVNQGGSALTEFDLGGAFVQQIEAGSVDTSSLTVKGDIAANGSANIQGSTNIGGSLQVSGNSNFSGQLSVGTGGNSNTAFQVLNSSGTDIFTVDTVNGYGGTASSSIASATTSALVLQSGNATGATANSGNVRLDSGTATGTAGSVSVGTGAYAHNVFIGNLTGTSAVALQSGTGGITATSTTATGTGLSVVANSLSSGIALSVASTQTTNSAATQSGNLLNISRNNTTQSQAITQDGGTIFTQASSVSVTVSDHGDNKRLLVAYSACGLTISFNGSNFTQVTGTGSSICMYYLKNPSIGTFPVSGMSAASWGNFVTSWYNVDQTNPIDSGTNSATTSISPASSVGDVALDYVFVGSGSVGTGGAGQTATGGTDGSGRSWGVSSKAGTSPNTTMTWTGSVSIHIAATLHPIAGAALSVTGAVATISDSCTVTSGTCTNSANVLNITQQYSGATGAVLNVKNSGQGMAFQVQNAAGINVVSVDTTNARLSVGSIGTATSQLYVSGTTPVSIGSTALASASNVAVQGRYAFVTSGTNLVAVDVEDPANPLQVSSASTGVSASALYINGKYAYLAGSSTMKVYDISNPLGMSQVGSNITLPSGTLYGGPKAIYAQGQYVYIVTGVLSGNGYLTIYNFANPASPVLVTTLTLNTAGYYPTAIAAVGNYLYIPESNFNSGNGQMQVVSISNPLSPILGGTYFSSGLSISPLDISVQGKYIYLTDGSNGTRIIEATNGTATLKGTYTGSGINSRAVKIQGRYAYVTDGTAKTLQAVDVSNPASPANAGAAATTSATPTAMDIQGRYAYVINQSNSLQIFDLGGAYVQQLEVGGIEAGTLTSRGNLQVGRDATIQGGLSVLNGMSVTGDSAFVGSVSIKTANNSANAFQIQNSAGVSLLNADTTNMRVNIGSNGTATGQLYVAGTIPSAPLATAGGQAGSYGLAISGRYAYITPTGATKGVQVFDISNPASPTQVGTGVTTTSTGNKRIKIQGKYAYVAGGGYFQVFDISTPSAPAQMAAGTLYNSSATGTPSLYVQGKYAYVGDSAVGTLYVFDISNPAAVQQVANLAIGSGGNGAADLYAQSRYLYLVTAGTASFQIIDIANPLAPSLVNSSSFTTTGTATSVVAQGRYAYVGTTSNLYVIDVSTPSSPSTAKNIASTRVDTLTAQGRTLYAGDNSGAVIRVFDISIPASTTAITGTATAQSPLAIVADGRYVYTSNNSATTNTLQVYDMGGAYTQQLEAGSLETDSLNVRGNTSFASDVAIQGGLGVSAGLQVAGNSSFNGTVGITSSLSVGSAYGQSGAVFAAGQTVYNTGTITQSSTTITGSGTTFTSGMVGGTIYYSDGTVCTVFSYTSATSITSSCFKTISSASSYTIVYGGTTVKSGGALNVQTGTNSASAFQVQNASGTTQLAVNTTTGTTTVTAASASANGLNVVGPANAFFTGNVASISHTTSIEGSGTESGSILSVSRALTQTLTTSTVTFDAATGNGSSSAGLTMGMTITSQPNRVLVLMLTDPYGGTYSPSPVTWTVGGTVQTMTLGGSFIDSLSYMHYWYYQITPTAGSGTISASSSDFRMEGVASSWYGVDTSGGAATAFGTMASNPSGTAGANATVNVPSSPGQVIVGAVSQGSAAASNAFTSSGGETMLSTYQTAGNGALYSSWKVSGSGATTQMSSSTTGYTWSAWGVALKPAVPVTGLTLTGAAATVSSNCTGICTDATNVLNVNQQFSGSTGSVLQIQGSGTGSLLKVTDTSSSSFDVFNIADEGAATFKTQTNSTNAFNVQNASGTNILSVSNLSNNMVTNSYFNSNATGWSMSFSNGTISWGAGTGFSGGGMTADWQDGTHSGDFLSTALTSSTQIGTTYTVSFYAKRASASGVDPTPTATFGGGAATCSPSSITSTSTFVKVTCTRTATSVNANLVLQDPSGSTSAGLILDNVIMVSGTSTTENLGTLSVQGGISQTDSLGNTFLNSDSANSQLTIKTTTNNVNAFQVQNAAGSSAFNIDTLNGNLTVNGGLNAQIQSWATATGTGMTARDSAAVVVANGYVFNISGLSNGAATTSVQSARLSANGDIGNWITQSATPLPAARVDAAGVFANGYIYIIGGSTSNSSAGAQDTVYYSRVNNDGTLGGWNTTTAVNNGSSIKRWEWNAFVANGYIYVGGGANTSGVSQTGFYSAKINADGTLGLWSGAGTLGTAMSDAAYATANGYAYAVNGTAIQYAKLGQGGALTAAWASAGTLPANRAGAGIAIYNGYLYVTGGANGSTFTGSTLYSKINSDGTINSSWSCQGASADCGTATVVNSTALPTSKGWYGTNPVMYNGYMYAIGGSTAASVSSTTVYYTSTARVQMSGSLDLVGGTTISGTDASSGGNLTAGNTSILGQLNVSGMANLQQNLSVGGNITALGSAAIQGSSTTALTVADPASGNTTFAVDTLNNLVGIGTAPRVGGTGLQVNATAQFYTGSTGAFTVCRSQYCTDGPSGQYSGFVIDTQTPGMWTSYDFNIQSLTNSATAFKVQGGYSGTLKDALIVSSNNLDTTDPGGNWATGTVLKVSRNATTLRSINANGTINASGADYAEWIPWSGAKPEQGTLVEYMGNTMVVSSSATAGFVGNDAISDQDNAILVTFTGQVPIKITGQVHAGDYLVPNGDGTARGVAPSAASLGDYFTKVGVAVADGAGTTVMGLISGPGASNQFNPQAISSFSDINVTGTLTTDKLVVVSSAQFKGDIIVGGHIVTAGNVLSSVAQTAAGSGATIDVDGNDIAGTITITTGSTPQAGDLAKLIFSKAYGKAPHIVISASNDEAAGIRTYKGTTTLNDFMLRTKDAPAANTTYTFDYFIAQ